MTERVDLRRSLGRQIARNTVLGWTGRIVSVLGWTVMAPWMLTVLGAERFGLWSLLSVFSSLALTFDLGLQGALTKFVAEHRVGGDLREARALLGMGLVLYLALGALLLTAAAFAQAPLLAFFRIDGALRGDAASALLMAAAATLALNLSQYGGALLGGLQRLDLWSALSMVTTLVQIGITVLVLRLEGGVASLLAVSAGMNLVTAWIAVVMSARLAPGLLPSLRGWTRATAARLGGFSLALQAIGAGLLLQFQFDKVLFARWTGLASVAEYELAYRVAFGVWTVPALLLPPLLPAVAHLHAAGDHEGVVALLRRATRYVLAIALPIAAGIVALSPAVFAAWLGPGHEDAARAAIALGVVLAFTILTGVGSAVIRGVGRPGIEAEYFVVASLVHVPLSLLLIPRFGFVGGLWALVLSGVVGPLWFVVRVHRALALSLAAELRERFLPPIVASVIAGIAGAVVARTFERLVSPALEGRLLHLGALLAGGATLVLLAAGLLAGVRYVTLAELRALRARPAVAAGGNP
jgi:O-antigen/teichoic acid export membrane protein